MKLILIQGGENPTGGGESRDVGIVQGVFFNCRPPKSSKYVKPRLGESTLT